MKWKWIFALSLGAALGIAGTTTQASAYQNPKGYCQVQDKQIKPYGKVGYTVKRGYEGIKTWKIMR